MKIKKFLSGVLALTILCGGAAAYAAGTPGSAQDPLISKSYVDSSFSNDVMIKPLEELQNSMTVLRYKLQQATVTPPKGDYTQALPSGSSLYLSQGSGFALLSGGGMIVNKGHSLLDLSTGLNIPNGTPLSPGHRYLSASGGNPSVTITNPSLVKIYGNVQVTPGSGVSFSDVTSEKWYYKDVTYAVEKGLINGRGGGIYAPEDFLSIAEAIKLVSCIHQRYNTGSVTLTNDPTLWYKPYVDYAASNGIVTKTYPNYNTKISRQEFVSVFFAAMPDSEYSVINSVSDNAIPDVKQSHVYSKQIYAFYRAGILVGSDATGAFLPDSNIKRNEVAAILTRMFEKTARQKITLQ
ncbi:MAG: S-layer homology domain-containing protein [Oscillospiraceae bacterium]